MVDRLTERRVYEERNAISCLALALYCPSLRIGGTAHIRPPYLPVLNYLMSEIPLAVRESSLAVVTGVSFPLDGDPHINEQSFKCQTLARYHIRNLLIRRGFEPERVVNKFSPPNTVTHLRFEPATGFVEIRRSNPFTESMKTESFYL